MQQGAPPHCPPGCENYIPPGFARKAGGGDGRDITASYITLPRVIVLVVATVGMTWTGATAYTQLVVREKTAAEKIDRLEAGASARFDTLDKRMATVSVEQQRLETRMGRIEKTLLDVLERAGWSPRISKDVPR